MSAATQPFAIFFKKVTFIKCTSMLQILLQPISKYNTSICLMGLGSDENHNKPQSEESGIPTKQLLNSSQ
jgi:hypothetical protein